MATISTSRKTNITDARAALTDEMFYDDIRRLKKIHLDALEDSGSEVSSPLLLEISVLTLRCASKWLAAEQSYIWAKANDAWNGSHAKYLNFIQNLASGGTHFDVHERREILQRAQDEAYLTLFRIEELLVDIGKLQFEENTRRAMASAGVTMLSGAATPIRRTDSTLGIRAKNWIALVYQARETVWMALDLRSIDDEQLLKRNSFTQHASTRSFVDVVLKALSRPRPGSFLDYRGPTLKTMIKIRTKDEDTVLKQLEMQSIQPTALANNKLISPLSSVMLNFHFPVWQNTVFRGAGYTIVGGLGVLVLLLARRVTMETVHTALESTKNYFNIHLFEPAKRMADELFFNQQPKVSSRLAYEEGKKSLAKMLETFRKDRGLPDSSTSQDHGTEVDMSCISREYEKAIVHPIREVVGGDLIRLALIQAHALKVETLNIATKLEDVVSENHFNSQVLATLPAVAILQGLFNVLSRVWRWSRNEENSKEAAKMEIKQTMWDIQQLLIREDDGPSLFNYLSSDDRGSEGGGSENWGPATTGERDNLGTRRNSGSHNNNNDDDDDLLMMLHTVSLDVDPVTKYRRELAGQLIMLLHHLINLLIRSRVVLFQGRDSAWQAAMRDVGFLFAREGWTAHARLQLAKCLSNELVSKN